MLSRNQNIKTQGNRRALRVSFIIIDLVAIAVSILITQHSHLLFHVAHLFSNKRMYRTAHQTMAMIRKVNHK